MNTSSLGFEDRTRLRAAAFTFCRFSRMEPELSTTMPIAINVEIALVERGNDVLLVVDDRGMQYHFFDLLAENENAAVGGIRILRGAGRWRLGSRAWSRRVRSSRLGLRVSQEQRRQQEEKQ